MTTDEQRAYAKHLSESIAGSLESAGESLQKAAERLEKLSSEVLAYIRREMWELHDHGRALEPSDSGTDDRAARANRAARLANAGQVASRLSDAIGTSRRKLSGPILRSDGFDSPAKDELKSAWHDIRRAKRDLESLREIEGHDPQSTQVLSDRVSLLHAAVLNAEVAAGSADMHLQSAQRTLDELDRTKVLPVRMFSSVAAVQQNANSELSTARDRIEESGKWLAFTQHPALSVADESAALAARAGLNPTSSSEQRAVAGSGEQERRPGQGPEVSRDRDGRG